MLRLSPMGDTFNINTTHEGDTLNVHVNDGVTSVTIKNDRKHNDKNKTLENNVITMFLRR